MAAHPGLLQIIGGKTGTFWGGRWEHLRYFVVSGQSKDGREALGSTV